MKRTSLIKTASSAVIFMAILVMISAVFHNPLMFKILGNQTHMEFNTALCFLLIGISFWISEHYPRTKKHTYVLTGAFLFIFASLTISQSYLNYTIGIDQLFTSGWNDTQQLYPGRMSDIAALAFMMVGVTFFALPFTNDKTIAFFYQASTFGVLLLGLFGLISNFLSSEISFIWRYHTTMSIYSAFCFLLIGLNFILVWHHSDEYHAFYHKNEETRIVLISIAILLTATTIGSTVGFVSFASIQTPIYQSLLSQFKIVLFTLFLTTLLGAILVYWQIVPLVKRINKLKEKALASKIRLRAIMDHIVEGIITIDEHGIIKTANPKAAEMFGYEPNEIIQTKLKKLIPSLNELQGIRDKAPVLNILHFMKNHPFEFFGLKKNGVSFSAEMTLSDLYLNNQHHYVCIIRDISQRKAAEAMLQESEAQFRSAFDTAPIGMALISLHGKVTQINSSLCQMLGYTESELKQMNLNSITYPDDLKISAEKQAEILSSQSKHIQFVKRFYHKNGHIIWTLLNASVVRSNTGRPLQLIAQIQDITKQKEAEEQLNYKAHFDSLTGLANRNYLELNLNHVIANSQRNTKKFALFYLDLDKFKDVNDNLGHDAGDALLKIVAERLQHHTRKSDIVARIGGDEFILVLTELQDFQVAKTFADRIIKTLLKPIPIKGQDILITTSIGISFYPTDGTDAITLIKNADHALYRAKQKGRNNYQFCANEVSNKIRESIEFETAMQNAINKQEFKLYYLPIIDARSQQVTGVEALLRWQSDKYGMISPQQIIPIAEETGFIIPLSEWVIKCASQQILKFQNEYNKNLKLTVNISARQFMHTQLIDSVLAGLNHSGFNPKLFTLDVNENLIMQDPKLSSDTIEMLAKHGIKIIIDNFGSGYSSFKSLQDFAIEALKIDRSLIQQIEINSQRTQLIKAIITLAKNLNIKVIAEGVETKQQYEFLVQHGCNELQGYYICMPVSANDLRAFMQARQTSTEPT